MHELLLSMLLISVIASPSSCARLMPQTRQRFNVMDYGAVGDGKNDDTKAFTEAWADVCKASQGIVTLDVPKGYNFRLKPVEFLGPCASNQVSVQLGGTLLAEEDTQWGDDKEAWILFEDIDGLSISGGGQIDGRGSVWWKACQENEKSYDCDHRPTGLHIAKCRGLQLSELRFVNSPMVHISIFGCQGVEISDLNISAPEESPNTDGIDISLSSNVEIRNSVIGTGDDCIAISNGSSFINISGITCGPGHGISIGSLGKNGAYDTVEEVSVRDCKFIGTQNGARIKTWRGGSGYCRNVLFEHIQVTDANNPIIIDQNYNPYGAILTEEKDAVMVSNVTFRDVRGTLAGELAIDLSCSDSRGCSGIVLDGIDISSSMPGKQTRSHCNNARVSSNLCKPDVSCLNQ